MSTQSSELFKIACKRIPGGVSSPVRSFKHVGMDPIYFRKAAGAYLYDVDQKPYVDFCLSFGPHLLGHCPPSVVKAIQSQAELGTSYGTCHPKEVDLAGWILRGYPFLNKVRLVNSGTEAVMTAARIARGFTGRDKIVTFEGCYHGHSDGFLAKAGSGVAELAEASSKGVPKAIVSDTLVARLDQPETLREIFRVHGKEVAAVLLELIPANNGLVIPSRETIQEIFSLAREHGALVIADEVITGFRVGLSGASGYFDVKPDIVTLGKIIGGGLPLAAIAGRGDVMDVLAPLGGVYQAGTLSGNPLATSAGCAVMEAIFATPPYAHLESVTKKFAEDVRKLAEHFAEQYKSAADLPVQVRTFASMFWLHFGPESSTCPPEITRASADAYAEFFKFSLARGVYFSPSPYEVSFLSTAHTQSILGEVLESLCKK